ncbi:hypothetical protein ABT392_14400 [Paucibacter sp. JuS9]|uniref:hypothetical protein n=1 Tax=Paucibacter sp. JuS9 TaxID=3228748 RepID=UPI0037583E07
MKTWIHACSGSAFALMSLASSGVLAADEPKPTTLSETIKATHVDMPITTSVAAFMLGASGENVPRLSSLREFSAQVGRAFDANGKVANAVSAEFIPAMAIGKLDWGQLKDPLMGAWARTALSVATKVKSDKDVARSALGLQTILYAPAYQEALQQSRVESCMATAQTFVREEALKKAIAEMNKTGRTTMPTPDYTAEDEASRLKCAKAIKTALTRWNQSMVAVGFGRSVASLEDGAALPAGVSGDSNMVWFTAALGGGGRAPAPDKAEDGNDDVGWLLTAHWRRNSNASAKSTLGVSTLARQELVGLNLRWGSESGAFIAEYSTLRSHASGHAFADRKRAVLGFEKRLDKDLYLTLGAGRDTGLDAAKNSVLMKFSWDFASKPTLMK